MYIILGLVFLALLAFFFSVRELFFDRDDVTLRIDAPEEVDIGSEFEVFVTVTNSSRQTLRAGRIDLDLPSAIELVEGRDASFATLESRKQTTAKFRLRARGDAGTELRFRVLSFFKPGFIAASFQKELEKTVHLREIPFTIAFSFPADVSNGKAFTFFIRAQSRAQTAVPAVGVELIPPDTFRFLRAQPAPLAATTYQWDFGSIPAGGREEISVTGIFDADVKGGEFIARIGPWDTFRKSLLAFQEEKEFLNLQAGAVPVTIVFREQENPPEIIVEPGETFSVKLQYENAMTVPAEDVSIALAMADEAIEPRSVISPQQFTRSVSGEYVWDSDILSALKSLEPGVQGEIELSAKISQKLVFRSADDANQDISVRARTLSGGRVLGERHMLIRIAGQLSINAEVRYFNAPGGINTGPLPPKIGQETTYTVTLTVAGGTNGIENVGARVVLGPSVTYKELIEPENANVFYDSTTREVAWTIGDMPPGTGVFSPPKLLSFRISLIPEADDTGKAVELLSIVAASGEDVFVKRTLDAADRPTTSQLRDDHLVSDTKGIVEP